MQHCPGCGYLIPATWTACRRCGASLASSATTPAPPTTPSSRIASIPLPPPPPPAERPASPASFPSAFGPPLSETLEGVFVPRIVGAPVASSAPPRSLRGPAVALAALALFAIATWFTIHEHASSSGAAPRILAPRPPTNGLPTNLDDVVRMRAESTRHTAMQAIEASAGSGPVNVAAVAARQPGYQWVDANTDSKDSNTISVASDDSGTVVIAVAASNHSICAFGRRQAPAPPEYVTMANMPKCRAANAPNMGWSTEAGGAASDLPDDTG